MTLKQFNDRLEKDYDALVKQGNKSWEYFLTHAYEFAHYNEVLDFFGNMDEDDFQEYWAEKVNDCNSENIVYGVWKQWLNYNHPEYYNFFSYDSLTEILEYFFKTHKEVRVYAK